MVTKRTRWLSAISVVLMLISMLACIFPAFAQDVSSAEALLEKANKYEAKNFTDEANALISEFKDGVVGVIEEFAEVDDDYYNNEEYGYEVVVGIYEDDFVNNLVPAIKNQLTADASPLYSAKDLYEGFTTPEGETFKNYDIATKEDWYAVIADSDNYYDYAATGDTNYTTFDGFTFNFVADIDFNNEMMRPAGANPLAYFGANINGNGHTLSNLNVQWKRYNVLKYYAEDGVTKIKSSVSGDEATGGIISRLAKNVWVKNINLNNVVIADKSVVGETYTTDVGYGAVGLFGATQSGGNNVFENIIAQKVTYDIPNHKPSSGFIPNGVDGNIIMNNIYFELTHTGASVKDYWLGFCGHSRSCTITNSILVSNTAVGMVRCKGNELGSHTVGTNFAVGTPYLLDMNADPSYATQIAAINAEAACSTVAEAIGKHNAAQASLMENNRLYYDLSADGVVTKARGTGNVYTVTITDGEDVSTLYYAEGATVTIELPLGAALKKDGEPIEGNSFVMPAANVAVEIFYDESGLLAAAVQTLTELRNKYAPLEAAYVTDLAPITAWLADANAALENTSTTIDTLNALIESGNALSVELKADTLIPYTKKDVYTPFATINTWAIASKEDWIAMATAGNAFVGVTFELTSDIDFENTAMAPVNNGGKFNGTIDGKGFEMKNVNINGTGLIGELANGATIKNLVVSGTLTNSGNSQTGGISGYATGATIKNVGLNLDVTLASSFNTYFGGFIGRCSSNVSIKNCYFNGNLNAPNAQAGGATGYGEGYQNLGRVKNSFFNITGVSGIDRFHPNIISHLWTAPSINSYAIGFQAFDLRPVEGYDDVFADFATEIAAFEASYSLTDADYASGKVAYLINTNAEDVIFTNDPVAGTVSFADGTNGTRKVSLVGAIKKDIFVPAGGTFDLKTINPSAAYAVITLDAASTITDGVLTMANEDIEISVTVDDDSLLAAAKLELQAAYDAKSVYDAAYLNEGEDLAAWMADARAALTDPEVEIATVQELIAAAEEMTFSLKEGALVPYSKIDLYGEMNTTKTWAISAKEDWIKLTEDYYGADCHLTLYVTNDIDFESTNMKPLAYGNAKFFYGKLYGQGYAFKNIKIEMAGGTNQYEGVSLVGALRGEIHDLGLTGEVTNTGTTANGCSTAAFAAGANGGSASLLKNCWSDVTVKGPSDNRGRCLSVFHTRPHAAQVIENCINYGTVQSTSEGDVGASVFYGYGAQVTLKNSLDLGTIVGSGAGVVGAIASHHNGIQNFINTNSYSTNLFWGKTHAFDASGVTATMPDGSAITSAEQVDALFAVASAAEAAWKATNGANGTVFYKLDADKGVVFGTATDRVQKVTFTGMADDVLYLNVGATVTLADIAANSTFEVTTEGLASAVANGVLTVPNADITINVASLGDEELVQALADLQAAYDAKAVYETKYLVEGEALAAWLANADAALKATTPDKAAILDLIAQAEAMTLTLKNVAGSYVPYTKSSIYASINTAKKWGIATKADWLALVAESTTEALSYNGYTFYVEADIDFENTEMLPVGFGKYRFEGKLNGQGHVFENVNIVASGSGSGNLGGVGLFADKTGGWIKNIGLASGSVTSTGNGSFIGSFAGYFKSGTISNSWSALALMTPEGYTGYVGGFVGRMSTEGVINGCYFVGSAESDAATIRGIAGYGESYKGAVKNSFVYSAGINGISGVHPNQYGASATFGDPTINSYNIGGRAFDLRNTADAAYEAVFTNHADAIAAFEAKYALNRDAYKGGELAYKLNTGSAADGIYFTVANNKTVLGTEANQTIAITLKAGDEVVGVLYFNKDAGEVTLAYEGVDSFDSVEGGDAIVNNKLTITGSATVNVTLHTDVVLGDAKEDGVINLVDAIAVLRGSVDLDTEVNVANGDVNANGILDANDAVLIVRFWLNDPAYDGPALG